MKIDFANLNYQYKLYKPEIDKRIHQVLDKSNYIMGDEVIELEAELTRFTQAAHAITCSSGTDALLLALMAVDLKPGDEIITTPFTFIATAEVITLLQAKPVFVDIDPNTYNIDPLKIEQAITSKTKAIMPVSLYGQPADLNGINAIAKLHNLKLIVDGAQSFGATYNGKSEVHYCDIYTTSFFPAKPLGCYGDGGAVFTNVDEYAEKIRMLRVHGQSKRYCHKYIGLGGRLDTIQAAILLAKIPHYPNEVEQRKIVAENYIEGMSDIRDLIVLPAVGADRTSVFAQFTLKLKNRDEVRQRLADKSVPTAVHYPKPLHLQECFDYLGLKLGDYPVAEEVSREVMSLPMNAFVTGQEIKYICNTVSSIINIKQPGFNAV